MHNGSFDLAVAGAAVAVLALVAACDPSATDLGAGKGKTYAELVRADAPVVYWRFEETSGMTAGDSSGFARDAAYAADPELGVPLSAKLGSAIRLTRGFNAALAPDAMAVPTATWSDLTALTLEAWVRPSLTQYPEDAVVVDKGDSWNLIVTTAGYPAVQFPFAPGSRVTGPSPLTPGALYHLVGTYQPGVPNGTMKLYVNGLLVASSSLEPSPIMQLERPIHVAQGLTPGRWDFSGIVDEVAIYDHPLSAQAVQSHYSAATNAGAQKYSQVVRADAPVAYWRFEEPSGSVAADSSGHGHDGSYVTGTVLGASLNTTLGRAVQFHSYYDDDAVAQGVDTWSNLEALSLEAWIRPSQVQYLEPIIIVDKGDSWNLIITGDGHPGVQLPFGGVATRVVGPQALAIDSLYHLVGTYQPGPAHGTLRLYVNGELVGSSESEPDSILQLERPVHVGQGLIPGRWDYAGIVDEVAIYDHVLSASSVKRHYDAGH